MARVYCRLTLGSERRGKRVEGDGVVRWLKKGELPDPRVTRVPVLGL